MNTIEPPDLPATFTYNQAIAAGLSRNRLYQLRDRGTIHQIAHGLFRRHDAPWSGDIDLIEIALRAPDATLCLGTALARHDLTDLIPLAIDVALPRDRWKPTVRAPVAWHSFDTATFDIGRDTMFVDNETVIGIYTPERCIVDAFRLRHREGREVANGALRRWLRRNGSQPATLLELATHFPKAQPALRAALETLLD